MILKKFGYQVFEAACGKEALLMSGAESFDAILCDIRMPGLSGFDVLQYIDGVIAGRKLASSPVVIMTGDPRLEYDSRLSRFDRRQILLKPFGVENLLEAIEETIGRNSSPESREQQGLSSLKVFGGDTEKLTK